MSPAKKYTDAFGQLKLFDQNYPEYEQLPRRFRIEFNEIVDHRGPTVLLHKDGEQVGDPLTDNSFVDDGYRYHDVFHFANAAILGWSPMTRSLFGCKRRSNQQVAVVEDGGRAKVLEEVVCALIYDYGRQCEFNVNASEVPEEFVQLLRRLVDDREVNQLPGECWRKLIEIAIRAWKTMRESRGGTLVADLCARNISIIPRSSQAGLRQCELFYPAADKSYG